LFAWLVLAPSAGQGLSRNTRERSGELDEAESQNVIDLATLARAWISAVSHTGESAVADWRWQLQRIGQIFL
jgi:hypothetical protein